MFSFSVCPFIRTNFCDFVVEKQLKESVIAIKSMVAEMGI